LGKSAPKSPDPVAVSAADAKANKEVAGYNAALNRVDQSSPFGSVNWSTNGVDPETGAPLWTQQTNLSPELQGLFDSQIGAQQGISSAITGALGNLPTGPFDASGINTDDVRQRSFDSQMALMAPKFDKGWKQLEGTMSDRGIPLNSEIFNDQLGEYNRARDSSILGAGRQADLDASNEFQRQYGNKLTEYNLPLQQLSTLMGNSQSVGNPQFSGVPQSQMAGTDVAGNIWKGYESDMNAYNQQQSNMWGGLLGAGQLGLAAFSDIRLKRDIKRIGAMASGLPVYSYRYAWSDVPQIGVMAQEVLCHKPEAVSVHPSGFLMVDYSKIV
jgi:hypothetical protein